MKRTMSGYRAHELESIEATSKEGFSNLALYVIEGLPGFYRRLTQKAASTAPGRIIAFFGETLIDLVPAVSVNSEFDEAGYTEHKKALVIPSQLLTMAAPMLPDESIPFDSPELPAEDSNFIPAAIPPDDNAGVFGLAPNEIVDANTGEITTVEVETSSGAAVESDGSVMV